MENKLHYHAKDCTPGEFEYNTEQGVPGYSCECVVCGKKYFVEHQASEDETDEEVKAELVKDFPTYAVRIK